MHVSAASFVSIGTYLEDVTGDDRVRPRSGLLPEMTMEMISVEAEVMAGIPMLQTRESGPAKLPEGQMTAGGGGDALEVGIAVGGGGEGGFGEGGGGDAALGGGGDGGFGEGGGGDAALGGGGDGGFGEGGGGDAALG